MTTSNTPTVTVLVAAFNAEAFIAHTLTSALAQSYDNLEVLVIDDGSSDGTAGIVADFAARDRRLRLIAQDNRGLSATRNRGVAQAQGAFVAFLDHDDLWHRDKIALQVAALEARPDADVASCYSALVDAHHRCLGWRLGGPTHGRVYDEMLEWDMVSGGSVVLVRRQALLDAGPFDESLRVREDWDMWIRLARTSRFAMVPRVLVAYTRRPSNGTRAHERMRDEGQRVLDKARADAAFTPDRYRYCLARDSFAIACFCTIDGDVPTAWRYLRHSVGVTPWPILAAPRRWGLVMLLVLRSVAPALFRAALATMSKGSLGVRPGTRFDEVST